MRTHSSFIIRIRQNKAEGSLDITLQNVASRETLKLSSWPSLFEVLQSHAGGNVILFSPGQKTT